MKPLRFEECFSHLGNTYTDFYKKSDKEKAARLYAHMKKLYAEEASAAVGFGRAIKYYFENVELCVEPYDAFADIACEAYSPVFLREEEYPKHLLPNEAAFLQSEGVLLAGADFGHTMPDWDTVFSEGIVGLLDKAKRYLQRDGLTSEQKSFYLSVQLAYEGILVYIERLKSLCLKTNSVNAAFAAENLETLLHGAPTNLSEAMQLYFLYYCAQHVTQGNSLRSLGAVDDILYPYYKHDLETGRCTEEDARELLRYFLFKWNARKITANIPFNLCTHTNELTYLILEEYDRLNIPDPKLHIKCSERTTNKAYRMIMNSIRKGNNSFVFINDAVAKKALIRIGIKPKDAENYTLIGCYEPCAVGKELPCTLNGRILLPMAVETVLNGGKRYGSDKKCGIDFGGGFESFEELYRAVKLQLKTWCDIAMHEINRLERAYPRIIRSPILSATYESCMAFGKDAYEGGAKYNNSSICIFGLATAVDELIAIRKAVFEQKLITLSELNDVLKNNWKNAEKLRKICRDTYPKYGNNLSEVDELARDLTAYMSVCINGRPNGRDGVYRMGIFSIDWIIEYGKKLGASADGRYAGEPVSKNLSASVGMDKKGVTAAIHSATALDFTQVPNGSVLDLQIHPTSVSDDNGAEIMIGLLKTYLAAGGYAVHMNVLDPKTLKAAQKEPERYKNLQVRLCGWNVYFTDLDKEMQNNLILSMEER